MDDILEYRRKHREAYLKRVASAAASKAAETREQPEHAHANSLLASGVASSTASSLSGGQEGVPSGALSDSQASSAAGTLSSSNGKSGALTTPDLMSAATPDELSDLDDGYGLSSSCKRPTAPYEYERDLYEQLSDKTKRDRHGPARADEDYESSLRLARKLQKEFDSMEEVRKPDVAYEECLLASDGADPLHENPDVDLQKAIAKSLIDM